MPINGLNNSKKSQQERQRSQAGMSLLEAVFAITLLSVGLLGAAGSVSYSLVSARMSKNVTESKEIILSTLEQVENLRNTNYLTFGQIANVGGVNSLGATTTFSGFLTDFQKVALNPGADGIYGTSDDPVSDANSVRAGYMRKIEITQLNGALKRVSVTVRYWAANGKKIELNGVSYLNDDTRTNTIN